MRSQAMFRSMSSVSVAIVLLGAIGFAAPQAAELGDLVAVSGEVHLVRGVGEVLKPTMEGATVKDGVVLSGDTVVCVGEAAAKLRLKDGSELALSKGGYVSIAETPIPAADRRGEQNAKRSILVRAGDVAWTIAPSKTVVTDFELPTGLVRVTGTQGQFNVKKVMEKDLATKTIEEGEVFVVEMIGDKVYAHGTLTKGQSLEEGKEGNVIFLSALKGNKPFEFTLANDAVLLLDTGESAAISMAPDGKFIVEAVKGSIDVQETGGKAMTIPEGTRNELGTKAITAVQGRGEPQPGFAPSWPPERRRTTVKEEEPVVTSVAPSQRRIVASPSK